MIKGKNAPKTIIQDYNENNLAMIKGTWASEGCSLVASGGKTLIKIKI